MEELVLSFAEELFQLKNSSSISKEQLHHYIENRSFPDLKILEPTGPVIKKEELLALKDSFLEKAVYGGYQIYIIQQAEKLNTSSANTILKFLEEPEENIIAILTTAHRYQVLETILSRCQILTFQDKKETSTDFRPATEKLIQFILNRKQEDLMLSYQEIQEQILNNKETTIAILNELKQFCSFVLKYKYQVQVENEHEWIEKYQANWTEEELLHLLEILEKKEQELQFNVHLKAWLDSFLLEVMEV